MPRPKKIRVMLCDGQESMTLTVPPPNTDADRAALKALFDGLYGALDLYFKRPKEKATDG